MSAITTAVAAAIGSSLSSTPTPQFPTNTSFFSPFPLTTTTSIPKLHSFSSPLLCSAFPSNPHNPHFPISNHTPHNDEEEDEVEEHVIGDCLIFEDGVFEDSYLQPHLNPLPNPPPTHKSKRKGKTPKIQPQNLVPDEWAPVVDAINLTKKERRKISQELEFGQKIQKKKRVKNFDSEKYWRVKNEMLSRLNPIVLDNPTSFPTEGSGKKGLDYEEGGVGRDEGVNSSGNSRVEPKNPRWAVYGRGLDDITEFFNSDKYQPDDNKQQDRQKLFTKEEKALMNARIPKLAVATSQKWLPLHTLAAHGEFYRMSTLLKYNVDVNAADQDGLTALHKAITCRNQAITNYLLRESANPFVRDKDGATLLHYAVQTASTESIKTLLLHNIDINLQDNDGWTPLHLAVQSRRKYVVRQLLLNGADKTLKNQDGLTPLELCLHSGRDATTYELIKLLKQLPERPINRSWSNHHGSICASDSDNQEQDNPSGFPS